MAAGKTERVRRTAGGAVEVEGLKELQAALSKFDKQLVKQVRAGNKTVAELVAARARARALSLGGVQARVAGTIKAKGEARYAVLAGGGARSPEFFGANFGAYHDVLRETAAGPVLGWNQLPEWGGNQFTGGAKDLFLYRTIADLSPDAIERKYLEVFEPLLRDLAGKTTGA